MMHLAYLFKLISLFDSVLWQKVFFFIGELKSGNEVSKNTEYF